MATCQVYRNTAGNIVRVNDPNGKPSKLYLDLFRSTNNKEEALRLWAHYYVGMDQGVYSTNENGEPIVENVSELSYAVEPDDALRVATSNLPQDLVALQNRSANYETSDESEFYTHQSTGEQLARTTGLQGPINKMRIVPHKHRTNSFAEQRAEDFWGEVSEDTKMLTELGEVDKPTYIQKLTTKLKATAARGTLIHKYIQLRMTSNPAQRTKLQGEINKLHQESGIRPGFFR